MHFPFSSKQGVLGHRCNDKASDATFAHEPAFHLAFICMGIVHHITFPLQCCFTTMPYNNMAEQVTAYHSYCNMADVAQDLQVDLQQPCLCGSS